MKVWMWQRLWKRCGEDGVFSYLSYWGDSKGFSDPSKYEEWRWLCPKPNLVLVDRKHLGGME